MIMNLINTTYTANLSTILAEDVGTPELRDGLSLRLQMPAMLRYALCIQHFQK